MADPVMAESPGAGTVGESSQSARPEGLVRPRLDADDEDTSRSRSPQKALKREEPPPVSCSSETRAPKLVELKAVIRERDKLLEERQELEERLSTSISEAAALRQRLVDADALVAHAAKEREELQAAVKSQAEQLQAAEIAREQRAARRKAGEEQGALAALEEAEEAAEKANARCATFGRMVERLERKALADEQVIRELQSQAAGREEEMAAEVACGIAMQERIDAQKAKLLEKDALLLEKDSLLHQRQKELSRLETDLNVAKTSTAKSRARMVAAASAIIDAQKGPSSPGGALVGPRKVRSSPTTGPRALDPV